MCFGVLLCAFVAVCVYVCTCKIVTVYCGALTPCVITVYRKVDALTKGYATMTLCAHTSLRHAPYTATIHPLYIDPHPPFCHVPALRCASVRHSTQFVPLQA